MPDLFSAELSLIAFQRRVLALAEDEETPLWERLRFLGIVSSILDEFYMVRMPRLRAAATGVRATVVDSDDGLSPQQRLARAEQAIALVVAAQARCAASCLESVRQRGTIITRWTELSDAQRAELRQRCRDDFYPELTPLAMTLSPGHPLPHLAHMSLSLAVIVRHETDGTPHLSELDIPADAPRFVAVPGTDATFLPIEELLRANLDLVHPNTSVVSAHVFRVTRAGDLDLDEETSADLLESVATATARRPFNPAVRVEIERATPAFAVGLILESLRRDAHAQDKTEVVEDVEFVDGLLDLRSLATIPLIDDPDLEFTPVVASDPFADRADIFEAIRERDVLAHHPFDSFDETVVRFIRESAHDDAVTTIRITLYRVGEASPILDALLQAARAGKRVVAFFELKARFDERHNVAWARALEQAGANIVYGIVGLKTHAKVALVIRREGGRLRRYTHISTGNYNVRSGRQYTDLSLFSARDDIAADVGDLFNELTSAARAPQKLTHGALAAPVQLLPAILERIEREAANARNGLPASITIKVNGLSDSEVVRALYNASEAGVTIDLIVRGICTLVPGVACQSSRIQVVSIVGRLLEHSRIYRFGNNGSPEYFIGSSDLRPRNLRRRVEVLAPVVDGDQCETLDALLRLYLGDSTAWELDAAGAYRQRAGDTPSAQQYLSEFSVSR